MGFKETLSDEQKQASRDAFQVKRKRQLGAGLIMILIAVMLFYSMQTGSLPWGLPNSVVWPATLLFMVLLVFTVYNWRCPHCNSYLGREISPSFCSRCGAPLDDE